MAGGRHKRNLVYAYIREPCLGMHKHTHVYNHIHNIYIDVDKVRLLLPSAISLDKEGGGYKDTLLGG